MAREEEAKENSWARSVLLLLLLLFKPACQIGMTETGGGRRCRGAEEVGGKCGKRSAITRP